MCMYSSSSVCGSAWGSRWDLWENCDSELLSWRLPTTHHRMGTLQRYIKHSMNYHLELKANFTLKFKLTEWESRLWSPESPGCSAIAPIYWLVIIQSACKTIKHGSSSFKVINPKCNGYSGIIHSVIIHTMFNTHKTNCNKFSRVIIWR